MSAASMQIFAKEQDLTSFVVILQVMDNCQRTHHCDYQGDGVDDQAD